MNETETLTLTEFLRARLDEDEAGARASLDQDGERWAVGALRYDARFDAVVMLSASEVPVAHSTEEDAAHIARWDPTRVLAEVAAKRQIMELHGHQTEQMSYGPIEACTTCGDLDDAPHEWPCETLRALASVYPDHEDYRSEWRVATSPPRTSRGRDR